MQSDDPAFLPVGTDVSAKFKGAFCEARVKKIQKSVKCKVMFKDAPFGSASYDDTQIKGSLELNAIVEVPHGKTSVRAVVQHIKDGSSYTVVFNDGDERSLRRSQLCLKSGKHFDAAGNLDALPLTHPEQFSNPVMSDGKTHKLKQKKRKSQYRVETSESSSEESDSQKKDAGKVMCVFDEPSKKGKWFPAIIASPKAHKTSKLPGKNDVVVRSFKDGKYSVVPLACTTEFDVVKGRKIEQPASLKQAVEKAIAYSDRDELPSHWDRDAILGVGHDSSDDDAKPSQKRKKSVVVASSSEDSDSASEYSEERDRFVAQLYKFQEERGTPINKAPILGGRDLDLYRFYKVVQKMGGFNRVCNNNAWKQVLARMKLEGCPGATPITVRNSYSRYLSHFNSFYRRLGWRMDEISVAGTSRTSRQVRQAEKDKAKARKPPAAAADKDKDQKEKEQKEKDAEKEKDAKEKAKEKESKEKAKEKEKDVKEKAKEAKEKEKEAKEKEKEAKEREKEAKEKEKEAKEKEKEAKEKEKEAKEREKEKEREKNKEKEKQEKQNLSSSDKEKESKEKASEKKKDDKVKPKSHSPPPPPPSVSPRAPPEDDQDPDDGFVQGTLTTRFYIGQKVRAQHGQGSARRWYDARVLQLDVGPTVGAKTATKRCFLHYLGWNMRYDEWVGTAKIRVSMADRYYNEEGAKEATGDEGERSKRGESSDASSSAESTNRMTRRATKNSESTASVPLPPPPQTDDARQSPVIKKLMNARQQNRKKTDSESESSSDEKFEPPPKRTRNRSTRANETPPAEASASSSSPELSVGRIEMKPIIRPSTPAEQSVGGKTTPVSQAPEPDAVQEAAATQVTTRSKGKAESTPVASETPKTDRVAVERPDPEPPTSTVPLPQPPTTPIVAAVASPHVDDDDHPSQSSADQSASTEEPQPMSTSDSQQTDESMQLLKSLPASVSTSSSSKEQGSTEDDFTNENDCELSGIGGETPNYGDDDGGELSGGATPGSASKAVGRKLSKSATAVATKRRRHRNYSNMVTDQRKHSKCVRKDDDSDDESQIDDCASPKDSLMALKARIQQKMEADNDWECEDLNLAPIDPSLTGEQRIAALQDRIQDIRDYYQQTKTDLASLERRWRRTLEKKKKRERESKRLETLTPFLPKSHSADDVALLGNAASGGSS